MANIKGLYQDSAGYWRYQPSRKGLPKGVLPPAAVSLGTKDQAVAIAKLVKERRLESARVATGEAPIRRLREWVRYYLDDRKRVGRHAVITSTQMAQRLAHAVDYFGDVNPATVTRAAVMGFYGKLNESGVTHATVHQQMRYLRSLFYWLLEREVVKENPAARLRLPVVRQTRRDGFCTREERDRVMTACPEDRPDLKFVLMAGFYLGMRINEIANCRWDWFPLGAGYCVIQSDEKKTGSFETKTRCSRTVPLHPLFTAFLSSLQRGDGADYILHPNKKQGKQWLRWDPRRPFTILMRACELAWVTPHTMRHTFGSLHAIAGTPELKIRRWMGITQQTLDRHYAGLSPDDADVGAI
jgi:integrase